MTNDNRFDKFFKVVMSFEVGSKKNGYVNDKDDNGGETVFGITRKGFPNLKIWASLDRIPSPIRKKGYIPTDEEYDEIKNVYMRKFYLKMNIPYIQDDSLAMQMFDFGVNAGVDRAVRTLQSMMHITVDGVCGRQTCTTANIRHHKSVREDYRKNRIAFYEKIARKGNNQKFLKGWVRRANECDREFRENN